MSNGAERLRKALVPRIALLSSAATRPEHVLWVWLATQYLGEMLRGESMTGEHRQGELWARYGQVLDEMMEAHAEVKNAFIEGNMARAYCWQYELQRREGLLRNVLIEIVEESEAET